MERQIEEASCCPDAWQDFHRIPTSMRAPRCRHHCRRPRRDLSTDETPMSCLGKREYLMTQLHKRTPSSRLCSNRCICGHYYLLRERKAAHVGVISCVLRVHIVSSVCSSCAHPVLILCSSCAHPVRTAPPVHVLSFMCTSCIFCCLSCQGSINWAVKVSMGQYVVTNSFGDHRPSAKVRE